jgi:hypothetical protein
LCYAENTQDNTDIFITTNIPHVPQQSTASEASISSSSPASTAFARANPTPALSSPSISSEVPAGHDQSTSSTQPESLHEKEKDGKHKV